LKNRAFYGKLILGMCVPKTGKMLILLIFIALVFSCDMDDLFPSAGQYKLNILVNDISLDKCSFAKSDDIIRPYFEEPVFGDQDITGLMVYLRDSGGEVAGYKVTYCLEQEEESSGNEKIIFVKSLDGELPAFPLPDNLPMDKYTVVSQVMGGKSVLQKIEKTIYYLGKNVFSYNGINVNLPGITDSSQLVPKDTLILLEAELDFNSSMDPYIIWYDGKDVINEGNFSDGAGQLFWRAPEQSGFFSIRAEVFPADEYEELIGYQKEVSLIVTSMPVNMHLISKSIPELLHWYTFEGSLNDSKMVNSPERALLSMSDNTPKWKGADGTYGIVTDSENIVVLPKVSIINRRSGNWQTLFRFKPVNDGVIFAVEFDSFKETFLYLSIEKRELVLTLASPLQTVSQHIGLSSIYESNAQGFPFITAGVSFSFGNQSVTAQINILGDIVDNIPELKPVLLRANIEKEFRISLGYMGKKSEPAEETAEELTVESLEESPAKLIVIWDEFALYHSPPMDALAADIRLSPKVDDDNSQE